MRTIGWLAFALTNIFALGFLGTLVASAWPSTWFSVLGVVIAGESALLGFFGFGIPMFAAALATLTLWDKEKPLKKTLAWVSTTFGLLCGICLFILVFGWVIAKRGPGLSYFFGFGLPMLLCGGFGVSLLIEAEDKR